MHKAQGAACKTLAVRYNFSYHQEKKLVKTVRLPLMGQTMEEGAILRWYKQEGEYVRKGDMLFEVMTDKANIEVDSTEEGYLRKVLVPLEESIPVNTPVALLSDDPNEPLGDVPVMSSAPATIAEPASVAPAAKTTVFPSPASSEKLFITPRARKLAAEHAIPLEHLSGRGSGAGGRIQEQDVRAYLHEKASLPTAPMPAPTLADERIALSPLRRLTAEAVSKSYRDAPHVTLFAEVDAEHLVAMRARLLPDIERACGLRISYNDLLIKACALALAQHPRVNARWGGDHIQQVSAINIGFAVALDDALAVPVVHCADQKNVIELTQTTHDLSRRAREGKLKPDDLQGGSFSISNLGAFGIDGFTPIITPGQAAILGVGQIAQRPAVWEGQLTVRHQMILSLSFDHRVVDGAPAAQFLQTVKGLIEEPYRWLMTV